MPLPTMVHPMRLARASSWLVMAGEVVQGYSASSDVVITLRVSLPTRPVTVASAVRGVPS